MSLENLDRIIEGILFVSGDSVATKDIQEKLDLTKAELDEAVKTLAAKYGGDSGVILLKFGGKLQFATNPKYVDAISSVLNPIKEKELSRACLETLAVIAYKQPVTRLEIEDVRGVSSDYTCQILEKNALIEVVGRKDTVGKPLLFGTTEEFLKRFGLESLDALPDYDELMERLQTIESPQPLDVPEGQDTLYNHFDVPMEEETPDFLIGEDVQSFGDVKVVLPAAENKAPLEEAAASFADDSDDGAAAEIGTAE